MLRLRQVSRKDASDNVLKYYDALFPNRDPVDEPGTATGTPGNRWSVFALVPYIFDHATATSACLPVKVSANWITALESSPLPGQAMQQEVSLFFHNTARQPANTAYQKNKSRQLPIGRSQKCSTPKSELFWPGLTR